MSNPSNYQPPYTITAEILNRVAAISEAIGRLTVLTDQARALRLRRIDVAGLGHEWAGGPGGHLYCRHGGPPLTALCARFLREVGVLGRRRGASAR